MTRWNWRAALACVATAMCLPLEAPALAGGDLGEAQAIRELDIMLMVSSLRCRHGPSNFQPAYESFSARHLSTLNAAYRTLHDNLAIRYGARGAKRQLDNISVAMANSYGQGHPWLDCNELGSVTRELASLRDGYGLYPAAVTLLADYPPARGRQALAARP